jgi:plastocyanin
MRFTVIVMAEDEFNTWVAEQGGVETPGGEGPPVEETPEDGASKDGGGTPPPGGAIILEDNVVHVEGQDGDNPTINVPSGAVVPVVNAGRALHNLHVSPFEEAICSAASASPCTDPPRMDGGDEGTITLDVPEGTYEYRCDFHPIEMSGTLVVGPPEPAGGGAASDSAGGRNTDTQNEPAGE